MLTKEQILEADDLKTEVVEVPEWGGDVTIRIMSGTERDAFEQALYESAPKDKGVSLKNIRARLCATCIVNGDGKRMFSDSEIATLGKKSSVALDRVFAATQKLNALTPEDIDELAKNSGSGQSESSTST